MCFGSPSATSMRGHREGHRDALRSPSSAVGGRGRTATAPGGDLDSGQSSNLELLINGLFRLVKGCVGTTPSQTVARR